MIERNQKLDRAWASGFFDGDGCVRIKRGRDVGDFHLRLDISQNNPLVLRDFVIAVGVHTAVKQKTGDYEWPMHCVTYASNKAKIVIERLVEYSIAKRAELELALEFSEVCKIGYRGWRTVPADVIALRAEYAARMADLKRFDDTESSDETDEVSDEDDAE